MRLRFVPLAAAIILAFGLAGALLKSSPSSSPSAPDMLPGEFELPSYGSSEHFSLSHWKDSNAIVNVFASWCEPCAAEHTIMMGLHQREIKIVGIAWKDKPDAVRKWLDARGNPYEAVGLDAEGRSTVALGLTGVPETFVMNRGKIIYRHRGPLTQELADTVILPLIKK